MIKLIVTDIDGTLLPAGGINPSADLKDIIMKYLDQGTVMAIASGRPFSSIANLFPEINDKLIFICSNGTQIVYNGKTVAHSTLAEGEELSTLMKTIRLLDGCEFMADTAETTLVENSVSDYFYEAIKTTGIEIKKVEDISESTDNVMKISVASLKGALAALDIPCVRELKSKYTVVQTGKLCFDITNRDASKGNAVEIIQKMFGIKQEETVVFGDEMNDISMFKMTPNSYAVENASEEVKKYANNTILPPEQDGVAKCLRSLL